MNTHLNRLFAQTVSLLGISAIVMLASLPGFAQSLRYDVRPGTTPDFSTSPAPSAGTATTDPAYGNPGEQTYPIQPQRESRNTSSRQSRQDVNSSVAPTPTQAQPRVSKSLDSSNETSTSN
jgi:hypothetical protein